MIIANVKVAKKAHTIRPVMLKLIIRIGIFMGGTRIFELGGSEGARLRAWGQKQIFVIGVSTK